jgi:hypothetical protein
VCRNIPEQSGGKNTKKTKTTKQQNQLTNFRDCEWKWNGMGVRIRRGNECRVVSYRWKTLRRRTATGAPLAFLNADALLLALLLLLAAAAAALAFRLALLKL